MNPSEPTLHTTPVVLPFRAPASNPHLADRRNLPHDLAALRRPAPVRHPGAPEMRAADGLAHDARNLLTSLELFSSMLAEPGVLSSSHGDMAQELASLTGVLGHLLEQLAPRPLPEGRGTEASPMVRREPLRPRPVAVAKVPRASGELEAGAVVQSCERLLSAIAGPQVALQINTERGLPPLSISTDELTRVLINLVRNASEAMPHGGRISIQVRKAVSAQPAALITVQDTGCGIPPHALGQIFQAGFTSKKAPGRWLSSGHHGLGLTIVRNLVEDCGGSVRVTSALKKGTTFELKVPCFRS